MNGRCHKLSALAGPWCVKGHWHAKITTYGDARSLTLGSAVAIIKTRGGAVW